MSQNFLQKLKRCWGKKTKNYLPKVTNEFSLESTIYRPLVKINIKHYKRSGWDISRQLSLVFHQPSKQYLQCQTKGDWIIPLERRGLFCTMIHQGEPLWLFQRLSEAGLFFILPDGQLNERSFLSFSIFSILLTPPLFFTFHLPFNLSPSKDHLFISSLTFQGPLFFWCNEEHFRSVTLG